MRTAQQIVHTVSLQKNRREPRHACASTGTTNLRNHLSCCKHFKTQREGQDHNISQQVISKEDSMKNAKKIKGSVQRSII